MATTTLTPHQGAMRSTVAIKALMAVTGLILIGFLLVHMYGNLKMFLGAESFNHYAHWLKSDILYPLVPAGSFIWVFRAFLVLAIVAHMWSAWTLTTRAHGARNQKYQHDRRLQETYSARTMRWGGVILAGFLVFHLLQFTSQTVTPGFTAGAEPYDMVIGSFRLWWVGLAYALWMVTVCMHVRHGTWSALTTLGANTSPQARSVLNAIAWVVAVLLYAGFMVMPVAVFFGWIN